MKPLILIVLIFSWSFVSQGQTESSIYNIEINYSTKNTKVKTDENGNLYLTVSLKDSARFKANGYVAYSDFGAKGDGKTDDFNSIVVTHALANKLHIPVHADAGAKYYIGGNKHTAVIKTNTDFGSATFIIDDSEVQNIKMPIFKVSSNHKAIKLKSIASLQKGQVKIDATLSNSSIVTVTNNNVKHYIRFGLNKDHGSAQSDLFLVDKNGYVNSETPIIWDFEQITSIKALPIEATTLTITGGEFVTIANNAESKYNYYARNININRSNVRVENLTHRIIKEGEHGAPYSGFISIHDCSNVMIKNTLLTGHKTYQTIGSAGKPVSMGSYDIMMTRALNVSFINCSQTNDINDPTYWGIMGSNYCKNILLDKCTFSRFDAHKGVANTSIKNSTLGHMGINIIGTGTFTLENSKILGRSLINLRSDYGSTWQGNITIRNCVFKPANGKFKKVHLFNGNYSGQHDFGYTCHMPENILIEGLQIIDTPSPKNYEGPTIFSDFNRLMTDDSYKEKFPYVKTNEVILRNVSTTSKKPIRRSNNTFMFKDVIINYDQ